MNETETMTPSAEFRFTSTDGVRVACARWDARTSVRGTVQIAHGMGEHIGRYVGLIEALVGAGLDGVRKRSPRTRPHRGATIRARP